MTKSKVVLGSGGACAAALASVAVYYAIAPSDPGEDVLDRSVEARGALSDLHLTGEPLFPTGRLYLDGRSSWCRQRFEEDRAALAREVAGGSLPVVTRVDTVVHREPFTSGPWVDALDPTEAAERRKTESQAVEVTATFVVRGIEPLDLIVFVLCSDFHTRLPVDPSSGYECVFPGASRPVPCLGEMPELDTNTMMCRERWRATVERAATDLWYLNRVGRDGEVYYYVFEAWKNCPQEGNYVNLRMSSGQYAVAARGGDCVVHVRTYYSGQEVPSFPGVDFVVSTRTRAFYAGLAQTLQDLGPSWEPSEDARRWKQGLVLGGRGNGGGER